MRLLDAKRLTACQRSDIQTMLISKLCCSPFVRGGVYLWYNETRISSSYALLCSEPVLSPQDPLIMLLFLRHMDSEALLYV